jgi:transcription factor C subunit 6
MRLRQSNKQKRFNGLPDYGLDVDISDAENTSLRVDSSEDEFVADAVAGDDEEEPIEDEAQSEQGEEDEDDDGADLNEPTTRRSVATSAAKAAKTPRAKLKTPARLKQGQSDNPEQIFVEVPPYPSDPGQRWTRTYIGPIKRWTRFYELIDWWFGDKPNRRVILDGYIRLWWEHELIPPKLISQPRLMIAQSGWMSNNFVGDQRSKFCQLYSNRLVHQFRQQKSVPIDRSRAFRQFLPRAQGELTVLLGHVSDQTQYRIRQGESISFSEAGTPIDNVDDQETTTGGWLLDVGGIPVAMAWAPAQGQVDQLLAIAVTPFSDQAYYQNLKDAPKESDQKEGTVQVIRFEAVKDKRGIFRPSRRDPRLAQALCFSWGRVSRIQWCPIPLMAEDTTRLLGVLCVDGKLRIIGVQNASEKDGDEMFGKYFDAIAVRSSLIIEQRRLMNP